MLSYNIFRTTVTDAGTGKLYAVKCFTPGGAGEDYCKLGDNGDFTPEQLLPRLDEIAENANATEQGTDCINIFIKI